MEKADTHGRRIPLLAWIAGAGIVPALLIAGIAITRDDKPSEAAPVATAAISTTPAPVASSATAPSALTATGQPSERAKPELMAENLEGVIAVTSKQCFGSAGCSVTARLSIALRGPMTIADYGPGSNSIESQWRGSWLVAYVIRGDKSGPILGTIELTSDGSYATPADVVMTTASQGAKVTMQVTAVMPQY